MTRLIDVPVQLMLNLGHEDPERLPSPRAIVTPRCPRRFLEAIEGLRRALAEDPEKGVTWWLKRVPLSGTPESLVDFARRTNSEHVCLYVENPPGFGNPAELGKNLAEMAQNLAVCGQNLFSLDTAFFFLWHALVLMFRVWRAEVKRWPATCPEGSYLSSGLTHYIDEYQLLHSELARGGVAVSANSKLSALWRAALYCLTVLADPAQPLSLEHANAICEALWSQVWQCYAHAPSGAAPQQPGPVGSLPQARNSVASAVEAFVKLGAGLPATIDGKEQERPEGPSGQEGNGASAVELPKIPGTRSKEIWAIAFFAANQDWTHKQIAEAIGVSPGTVSRYELFPRIKDAIRLVQQHEQRHGFIDNKTGNIECADDADGATG
jgi:hypothetical protein